MASREEYIEKLESQLKEWNSQLDDLQKKAEKQSQEAKVRLNNRIDELKSKRATLKVKLDKIKDSGDEAFEKIKGDAEDLWADVKEGFSDIRSILKEK
ncbi:MAG: hypothetical protein ACNS64_01285 [Candidatus Halalkalibacterium sp. M3_1C_030]